MVVGGGWRVAFGGSPAWEAPFDTTMVVARLRQPHHVQVQVSAVL